MPAATLPELFALKKLSPHTYETILPPERMGNAANIAYGGCTLAAGINAACQDVPPSYRLYSALGSYLGPALTDRKLQCRVTSLRNTRTFATRLVEVSQTLDNGSNRACMVFLADFQLPEKASLLVYSKPPTSLPIHWRHCQTYDEVHRRLVAEGTISEDVLRAHDELFSMSRRFVELRSIPGSIMAETLKGAAKTAPTSQEHLRIYDKTSSDWIRQKQRCSTYFEQISALAWLSDMAVAFIPLMHNHMYFDDTSACSSLEFALRVFKNEIDPEAWMMREFKTVTGGAGRNYSETQFWDEEGVMVASMTQQSILRPAKGRGEMKL